MPRIFLKPKSPEFASEKQESQLKGCDMPGCAGSGDHRAPKSRDLNDYYWFCQEHAREYNQAWNYFAGMSGTEVEDQMLRSLYGDRPTWRYDTHGAEENLRRAAWQARNPGEKDPAEERKHKHAISRNTPEGEAMAVMGLEPPVTLESIKARYKELAKKHHPDLNGGCVESEELLKSINMAYTILKVAYDKYKDLEEKI